MKKALENPVVVGILALVAVFVVYRAAFKGSSYDAPPPADQESSAKKKEKKSGKSKAGLPKAKVDVTVAQWANTFDRDPFGSEEEEREPIRDEAPVRFEESLPETSRPDLKLSAIWVEGEKQMAVINDKVVEEGEHILDFEIERILANQVIVHGSGGRAVVGFPGPGKPLDERGKAATGELAK